MSVAKRWMLIMSKIPMGSSQPHYREPFYPILSRSRPPSLSTFRTSPFVFFHRNMPFQGYFLGWMNDSFAAIIWRFAGFAEMETFKGVRNKWLLEAGVNLNSDGLEKHIIINWGTTVRQQTAKQSQRVSRDGRDMSDVILLSETFRDVRESQQA